MTRNRPARNRASIRRIADLATLLPGIGSSLSGGFTATHAMQKPTEATTVRVETEGGRLADLCKVSDRVVPGLHGHDGSARHSYETSTIIRGSGSRVLSNGGKTTLGNDWSTSLGHHDGWAHVQSRRSGGTKALRRTPAPRGWLGRAHRQDRPRVGIEADPWLADARAKGLEQAMTAPPGWRTR